MTVTVNTTFNRDALGFLSFAADEIFTEFTRLITAAFGAMILPRLIASTPRDTGALRGSFRLGRPVITRQSSFSQRLNIAITIVAPGERYYQYQRGLAEKHNEMFTLMIGELVNPMFNQAIRNVLA